MIKVGFVGGTGYTGVELLRLLAQHPRAELAAITSRKEAGMPVADLFPSLRGAVELAFSDPAGAGLAQCDVVFFATPNGVAMGEARALVERGVRVIDLAADFRLRDVAEGEKWYALKQPAPEPLAAGRASLQPRAATRPACGSVPCRSSRPASSTPTTSSPMPSPA